MHIFLQGDHFLTNFHKKFNFQFKIQNLGKIQFSKCVGAPCINIIFFINFSKSEILETEKNVLKDRFAKVSDISINSSSNYPIYASNGYSKAQPKMQISFLKAKTIVGTQSYHSLKPIEVSR